MPASDPPASGSSEPSGRIPDFFIVGHPKCGTTALYRMLKSHPGIYMSAVKEPQFFASDLRVGGASVGPSTLDEYVALFAAARPDQLVGDASTRHIWSPTAPARIAEAQPTARIIAVLREPASFLRSLHLQLLLNRAEDEPSLRKAIELEPERRQGRRLTERAASQPLLLMYTERARYLDQLRRYHTVFPAAQVLVLIYEDFRSDNEGTVRQVLRFLGIDDAVPLQTVHTNPTVARRIGADEGVWAATHARGRLAQGVKGTVRLVTPRRLLRSAFFQAVQRRVVFGEPPPPDENFMLELRQHFKPQVDALGEYLDRDLLALWGYENV
jgi:Sulfotransferase domain